MKLVTGLTLCLLLATAAARPSREKRQLAKESPFVARNHNAETTDAPQTPDSSAPKVPAKEVVPGPFAMGGAPMGFGMGMPVMGGAQRPGMLEGGSPMGEGMPGPPQGNLFGGPLGMSGGPPMGAMPPRGTDQNGTENGLPPSLFGEPIQMPQGMHMMQGHGMPPSMMAQGMQDMPPSMMVQGMQGHGMPPSMMAQGMQGHGMPRSMMAQGMQGHGMPPSMMAQGMQGHGMPPSMMAQGIQGMPPSMMAQGMQGHGMPPSMMAQGIQGMPPSMMAQGMQGHGMPPSMMAQGMQGMPPSMMAQGMQGMSSPMMAQGMQAQAMPTRMPGQQRMPGVRGDMSPMMLRALARQRASRMMASGMPPMMRPGMPHAASAEDKEGKKDLKTPPSGVPPMMAMRGQPRPRAMHRMQGHADPQLTVEKLLDFESQIDDIRKAVLGSFYTDLLQFRAISKVYRRKMLSLLYPQCLLFQACYLQGIPPEDAVLTISAMPPLSAVLSPRYTA
ncbi:pre-mRNA 3' end processing protein WDR33-like isoform X2 [Haliotis rufescens]|uniref:pre-mRNA 3' end processing protein WDR33-like isoform X2 n=1 Tax=Haliotis rufescens TaxID=6454 RepID=UPI00201ED788|nr:pre-mRNA 3' end processing protein WDR33-like isoform X2 [Haliotis rufescens]